VTADRPALRIVAGGEPTPEELTALVVAITAATESAAAASSAASSAGGAGRRRGGWADRSAGLRRPLRAGAGAWRHYGFPI
jgi:hypothetical protein